MKFTAFGVRFEISFLFTAILALMVTTDKTGNIFIFFSAALIHEAAHLVTMVILKTKPTEVKLIPGGINIVEKSSKTALEDVLILVSGPLSNLLCFLIFKNDFSLVNLLLFIYNMLPISGLDGGRLAYIFFSKLFGNLAAEKSITLLTILVATFFLIVFVCLFLNGVENYSILIFSLYIISTVFLKNVLKQSTN